MGWRDLLSVNGDEREILPWTGGRSLRFRERGWYIEAELPRDYGWCTFKLENRAALYEGPALPVEEKLGWNVKGYLVGDRIIPDGIRVEPQAENIIRSSEPVMLIEAGIDRFERIVAGRICEDGPLIFKTRDFPLGPENDVFSAFLDKASSVDAIPNVYPALDAAFRMESWQRKEAERRRILAEKRRQEEQERLRKEEERRELLEKVGSPVARRQLARVDFAEAARASLAAGNAEYLDHRKGTIKGEYIVRFKIERRKFECVCDEKMHVIDGGLCLVDHRTGFRGDTLFTLESLPSAYREAMREGKLVVFRHVY